MAAVIRLMRLTREWSQEELGARAGLKSSEVSLIESGRRNPTLWMLQRLGDAFGMRCSHMVELAEDFEANLQRMEQRSTKS
ncbi:MAG TPA: helix-turn-helix transcriptional regulator [Solirubrobacterales bacterium]|nr:helix-turn-helix transcriptional regulator [Solirubrobacterales bacterium]